MMGISETTICTAYATLHQKDTRLGSFPDLRDGMLGGETKRIVFFTLPPVREIDLVGAVDVFTSANTKHG